MGSHRSKAGRMREPEKTTYSVLMVGLLDAALVALAFYLGYHLRRSLPGRPLWEPSIYLWLLFVFIPTLLFLLNHYGLLSVRRSRTLSDVALCATKAFLVTGVLLSGALFVTKARYYSRLLLAFHWAFAFALVLGEKLLLHHLARRGVGFFAPVRWAVLVGEGERVRRLAELLRRDPGYALPEDAVFDTSVSLEAFRGYLLAHPADEVFFVLPPGGTRPGFEADRFFALCESLGVPAQVVIHTDEAFRHYACSFTRAGDLPVLVFHPLSIDPDRAAVKRLMDLVGSAVGLLVTALLTPLIALAVKLDSRGPAFFVQERIGQNGRRFRMYKFRTMRVGADSEQEALGPLSEMRGPIFKIPHDPRVTRVGRLLRRLSLDELPQFWNVLRGDMSLVGTRPPTPQEVERYELWHYRRLSVRPGLTGLWQAEGRGRIRDFDEIVRLDLQYVDRWSLGLDVKVLLKTLLRLGRGK